MKNRFVAVMLFVLAPAAGAVIIEPDDYAPESVLNNVSPYVTLSVEVPDGNGGLYISPFDVTANEGDFGSVDASPTGDLVFGHANIPFFPADARVLRGDFVGTTDAVAISFSPSSTLSGQVGRLEAYNSADQLIAFDETALLQASSSSLTVEVLSIDRPSPDIAYFRAFTAEGSFGRYDALTFNQPVPEPTSLACLLLGLAFTRRRASRV